MRQSKIIMAIFIIIAFSINFISCTNKIISENKLTEIKIPQEPLIDTIYLQEKIINNDTIYVYNEVVKKDTIIKIKYYPKNKKLNYYFKLDTIKIYKLDTIYKEIKTQNNNSLKDKLYEIVLLAGVIIILIILFFGRK